MYNEGVSIGELARKFNTYNMKIYRLLKDNNIPIRDKSDAQKIYLSNGGKHPTEGKHHNESTKNKIGKKLYDKWKESSEEEKQIKKDKAKLSWEEKTDQEKEEFKKKSLKHRLATCKEGSKLEKMLVDSLRQNGFDVIPHRTKFLPNLELETDILIPSLVTVIEVDGPTHFMPIFGEEKLVKVQQSDAEKNGLLIKAGYNVIRLRYKARQIKNIHLNLIMEKLLPILESFKNNKSNSQDKLHILEFKF